MVAPGGSAKVVYDDGCKVDIQPGAVATIAPISPCASGSYAQTQTQLQDYAAYIAAGGTLGLFAWLAYEASQTPSGTGAPVNPVTSP